MQFSVRDLLWLMAVVALAATVYAERVHLRRLTARWEEASERSARENAVQQAELRAHISGLRERNAILQHQLVVRLERERQREAESAERPKGATIPARFSQPGLRPGPPPIDDAEVPETIEATR